MRLNCSNVRKISQAVPIGYLVSGEKYIQSKNIGIDDLFITLKCNFSYQHWSKWPSVDVWCYLQTTATFGTESKSILIVRIFYVIIISKNINFCHFFQIDRCDRLWAMDSGAIGNNQTCPPQLLAFDLKTNNLIRRFKVDRSRYIATSIFITPVRIWFFHYLNYIRVYLYRLYLSLITKINIIMLVSHWLVRANPI